MVRDNNRVKKSGGPGSRFDVRTPAAIAGVRGTSFEANFAPGQPTVAVQQAEPAVGGLDIIIH